MSEQKGYYQDMGPFGTGFWVGYGGGMAVMFWATLFFGLIWGDWSSASAESATSGIVFMNIIAVLMGIGHAGSASSNATSAAQTHSEGIAKPQELNGGKGLDPEIVTLAFESCRFYIESGARKFRELVCAMMEDTGLSFDQLQPYARNAYNQLRDDMDLNGDDVSDMDSAKDVLANVRDIANQFAYRPI